MDANDPTRPTAYSVLMHSRNRAADAALVAVFPRLDPRHRELALSVLLARDHDEPLADLVATYDTGDQQLRALLCQHADALSAGARICIAHERFEARRAAIDLIRSSRSSKLAYLLAEALRSPCRNTVERAAQSLGEIVEHLDRQQPEIASARGAQARSPRLYLAAAVKSALASWPLHLRPEVISAAAQLADLLEKDIIAIANTSRSRVSHAFANALSGATDPRLAGYCLRMLRCEPLRAAAAQYLAESRDAALGAALLREAWLLADEEVRRSCARVRGFGTLSNEAEIIAAASAGQARAAVHLLVAAGGRSRTKLEVLRAVALGTNAAAARAATWAVIEDPSEEATETLRSLSARRDISLGPIVAVELRRRGKGSAPSRPAADGSAPSAAGSSPSAFDPYWEAFDTLPPDSQVSIGKTVAEGVPEFLDLLRAKATAGHPSDRLRALRIVQTLDLADAFVDEIHAAARDPDNILRSLAMTLLGTVDSSASRRMLHAALSDRDERVQANAIEAIERIGGSAEATRMLGMLDSPASRVRANAVKALINLGMREGARRLIAMLGSVTASDRQSALWVVERMRLQHLMGRIEQMVAKDPDERVRTRARRLLRKFKDLKTLCATGAEEDGR